MHTYSHDTIPAGEGRGGRDARDPRMNLTRRSSVVPIALRIFALAAFLGAAPAQAQDVGTPAAETDSAPAAAPGPSAQTPRKL